ncbi:MAG: DNA repair protein RecN [Proteobacteria bacterium]|nr:DNA repair protein RecN [Pseudomonadota bacterium]
MLQHLQIKDLAIVSQVDIAFSTGMTVITGETGAGKSILLDALNLVLGQRSDSNLVRPGAEKAEIAAIFDISSLNGAILWLSNLELAGDMPQQCVIRRILYANGRSKAFINGYPVITQQLRLLGEHLVQIHGQHQHQLLLKPSEQLRLLDVFGQHEELVSQVKTAFKAWNKIDEHRLCLQEKGLLDQSRIALIQYQMREIEALNLKEQEYQKLHQEHDQLAHATSSIQAAQYALTLLENHDEVNALQCINQAQLALSALTEKFPTLNNAHVCLNTAQIQLQEAVAEINDFIATLEINPNRLGQVTQRLEKLYDIARKHKIEPDFLLDYYDTLKKQTCLFDEQETISKQIAIDLENAKAQFQQFAQKLTNARLRTCEKLATAVTQALQPLGMPGGLFTAQLIPHEDDTLHMSGNETIIFNVSANPGHAVQPLHKVASGGELSRISLALELLTAQSLATPCLIFDEVDVGISGKIGAIVGKALHDLSESAQVLCITHLPQVASWGDHHLQVSKKRLENSTISEIKQLTGAERVEEIARLLGGMDVTKQARANAENLLEHKIVLTD